MSTIVFEIPEVKKNFFSEVFQTAAQNPMISTERKCRITNFFLELSEQQRQNHKLIYTTYSKQELKKMLTDLQVFYRNAGQIAKLSKVDGMLKELNQ